LPVKFSGLIERVFAPTAIAGPGCMQTVEACINVIAKEYKRAYYSLRQPGLPIFMWLVFARRAKAP
jgi:hypothetical protein